MSNVRRLRAACCENLRLFRSERALKEALPKSRSIGAAKKVSLDSASLFFSQFRMNGQRPRRRGRRQMLVSQLGRCYAWVALLPRARLRFSATLVAAQKERAGSPSASRKSSLSRSHKAFVAWHLGNSYSLAMQTKEAFHTETPNPSIERTRSGKPALAFTSFSAKAVSPARAA